MSIHFTVPQAHHSEITMARHEVRKNAVLWIEGGLHRIAMISGPHLFTDRGRMFHVSQVVLSADD